MSAISPPASGYASPLTATSSSTSLPSTNSKAPPKPKPVNVFSNDGSFLERFQRTKKEEEDKRKAEEALEKKRQFADRFKSRGKRPPPASSPAVTSPDPQESPAKKVKVDDSSLTNYKKEVRDYAGHSLRDTGTGVRPLVK
ncbi:hypothetical protein PAXRUDRAFT_821897 [Paxillus rubicundulus Ve08.2h10]|uniref:Uncharacterized protein n=1 Tax=Paxillus rubicundulus Ve08.2h10 TaxID=930991 RepID=A0A0D0E5V2_9AGAM|nr:hypothetical protein PAXRUDRAFT_821897 [Paxillus rubicundulus Ve08.2h10]